MVHGIRYLPRQDGSLNGTIVGYEVYVSLDCDTWAATPWMSRILGCHSGRENRGTEQWPARALPQARGDVGGQ